MEKFIPYEKLSKKEKRRRDAMQRGTWGVLNPVTRKVQTPKLTTGKRHGNGWRIHIPCLFYMQKRYPPAAGRGISKE